MNDKSNSDGVVMISPRTGMGIATVIPSVSEIQEDLCEPTPEEIERDKFDLVDDNMSGEFCKCGERLVHSSEPDPANPQSRVFYKNCIYCGFSERPDLCDDGPLGEFDPDKPPNFLER